MRGGRISAALVVGLLSAACSGGKLGNAEGDLHVVPAELVFERGWVGYGQELQIRLQNTGRTEFEVQVSIEGPFNTEAGPYRLPGGADRAKPVDFTPGAPGEFTGLLRYQQGDQVVLVPLTGHAEEPPACDTPTPCVEVWFDPEKGECQRQELPEGASCETGNACLVDGICVNHECLGTPQHCDDGNACTDDWCDPTEGCRTEPTRCPACQDDPSCVCKEPACNPDRGCFFQNRTDGSSCGEDGGCVDRYVCLNGECEKREVENGRRCYAPCGQGTCQDKECFRPEGDIVDPPAFTTVPVAPDRELVFPGLMSGDGLLVWFETARDGSGSSLEALAPPTAESSPFSQPYRGVPLAGTLGRAGALLGGDQVVIALDGAAGARRLEARRLADGAPAWGPADVASLLSPEAPLPSASLEVVALVDDGDGAVRVVAAADGRTAVLPLAADGTPGPIAWLDGVPAADPGTPGAVADADGNLYLTVEAAEAERRVVSLFADGSPRWDLPADPDEGGPLAVATGFLVLAPGRVRDAADGAPLFELPIPTAADPGGPAPAPLLGLSAIYAVAGTGETGAPALLSFDPADPATVHEHGLALDGVEGTTAAWTAPVLTTGENAMLGLEVWTPASGGTTVVTRGILEVRPEGEEARACRVNGLGALAGPPALRNGWVALAERAGSVKVVRVRRGADPATWGWSGPRGGPSGGNREAP